MTGSPWSLTRVHYLDTAKMTDALSEGWEPFAAVGEYVLLRLLTVRAVYGEWKPGFGL